MDSNEFLKYKMETVIRVIRRYANRISSNDSVTDKYFKLLANSLESVLLMEIPFSEKIRAIEFVIHDIDNNGIIGLAKEYIELAIEQAIEHDNNEVNK